MQRSLSLGLSSHEPRIHAHVWGCDDFAVVEGMTLGNNHSAHWLMGLSLLLCPGPASKSQLPVCPHAAWGKEQEGVCELQAVQAPL